MFISRDSAYSSGGAQYVLDFEHSAYFAGGAFRIRFDFTIHASLYETGVLRYIMQDFLAFMLPICCRYRTSYATLF